MGKREELKAEIAQLEQERDKIEALIVGKQEGLDALPKERVRLVLQKWGGDSFDVCPDNESLFGDRYDEHPVARVYGPNCKKSNIDPAALAAHICRFGEPDVSREMEAVVEAARKVQLNNRPLQLRLLDAALAALDAARKWGA